MNKNIAAAIANFVAMHHAGVTVSANGEKALFTARTQKQALAAMHDAADLIRSEGLRTFRVKSPLGGKSFSWFTSDYLDAVCCGVSFRA